MRATLSVLLGLAVLCAFTMSVLAQDVDLKGRITCAKCELKKETQCTTVIVVKEAGKDIVYYLDEKSGKANHSKICKEGKEGTVTGKVSEKDGKKIITATKVDIK
jgi:hypothetical protein